MRIRGRRRGGPKLAYLPEAPRCKPKGSAGGAALKPGEVLTVVSVYPNDAGVRVIADSVPMTGDEG